MTRRAAPSLSLGRRIRVSGTLQGVGLRPYVRRVADGLGLAGSAINTASGVEIEAFGPEAALDALVESLRGTLPGVGHLDDLAWERIEGVALEGFRLGARPGQEDAPGSAHPARRIALAPDLALCTECRAELHDPGDRRFGHAFVSCTACGPRVTIARSLPWARAHTTMADMPLCARCRAEFEDPTGRRHHAETIACPACGPRLFLEEASQPPGEGRVAEDEAALHAAARRLRAGATVALRGLGGYHIACRADASAAVERLRKAKRRPRKPFAVMVAHVEQARALAHLGETGRALLTSRAAPIVLLPRRRGAKVAPEVAPDLPWIGLMLAYTPLHVLLLEAVGAPLVMTSGNASGEPIVCAVQAARERLGPFVDAFLHHDREIVAPCDDSVVREIGGDMAVLRRARGYFPGSLALPIAAPDPILAVGAQMANTVCVASGGLAHPSAHVGDLDSPEAADAHAAAIDRLERWLGARCEIVAHDLHPGYTSTRLARAREASLRIPVQHHHAHVAGALVELGTTDPVVGIAYDGTGAGTDGTAWGGEILLARPERFVRLATLRAIPLLGGEVAIREVWRLGLALLEDAFGADAPLDALPLFRTIAPDRLEAVRALHRSDFPAVPAHGAGRYFDAFGALFLDRDRATYSGDVAMHWNAVADPAEERPYAFALSTPPGAGSRVGHAPRLEIDLREAVRSAVADRLAGRGAPLIAGRFHATLGAATAAVLDRFREELRGRPVVLTGGCFQNALLAEHVGRALSHRFAVHGPGRVPPGDGGISIGQAVVAAAVVRAGGGDAHLRGEGE